MKTKPSLRSSIRAERKRQNLGDNATCAKCGEADARCLTKKGKSVACYACQNARDGRATVERHHLAGQRNLTDTVAIPANDHRVLSDLQQDWPDGILRNPTGNPLIKASAAIRGWLNVLRLIIERTVGWIPDFLERLDEWLREKLGESYWTLENFPLARGVPQ